MSRRKLQCADTEGYNDVLALRCTIRPTVLIGTILQRVERTVDAADKLLGVDVCGHAHGCIFATGQLEFVT